jgi:hypothetical protein
LTSTGIVPSPVVRVPSLTGTATKPLAVPSGVTAERETLVQDLLARVRYLLTLKGRPPFRLAGLELVAGLQDVVTCLSQLLRVRPEPRLEQLRAGLRLALRQVQKDHRLVQHAAGWLHQVAEVLDPTGKPARTARIVRADWQAVLDTIQQESEAQPTLAPYATTIAKVSVSYAPGLFHTYALPALPRTNNAQESEFRDMRRRLLATTGSRGATKRLLQRSGAWELIPGPGTLRETQDALAKVKPLDYQEERERVRVHRRRFRMHTRSVQRSKAQLKDIVRRWQSLPVDDVPK